jgi:death on curing protein
LPRTPRRARALVFVSRAVVLALHEEQLVEHAGAPGLRDEGALDSALARARNRLAYGDADLAALAAAYAFGLARNHPFVDGNKRVATVTAELFLALNGVALDLADAEIVSIGLTLASGELEEDALAARLRGALRS